MNPFLAGVWLLDSVSGRLDTAIAPTLRRILARLSARVVRCGVATGDATATAAARPGKRRPEIGVESAGR